MLPLSVSIWSTMFCNIEILYFTTIFCSTIYFLPETGRWRKGCLWRRSRERRRWSVLQASLPLPVSLLSHSGEWGIVINIFRSGFQGLSYPNLGPFSSWYIYLVRFNQWCAMTIVRIPRDLSCCRQEQQELLDSQQDLQSCRTTPGRARKFKHLQQNLVWPG